jgi:hypothetical protein
MTIFKFKAVVTLLLLALISGCASTPKVYSDYDSREDFSKLRTFTWVQDPPMLRAGDYPVSALAETRMTAAIKAELIMHGYEFVDNLEQADFSVIYTMGARDKIELRDHPRGYYSNRVDWGWGGYYYPFFVHFPFGRSYRDVELVEYPEGTIALDIFNAKTKKPIWHTRATKRLSKKDVNSNARNAAEIAEQLLQDFPYKGCRVIPTAECRPFE